MGKILLIILFLLLPSYILYLIILYLKTKVPYVLTPKKYFPIIFKNLEINSETIIYDLGCGNGDFLFAAEKLGPKKLVGFELSPWHFLLGKIKAKILKSKAEIYLKDFFKVDISQADIIYLFLVESMVIKLWPKIKKEAKPGATVAILSNSIPGVEYAKIIKTNINKNSKSRLYIYKIK